MMKLKNSEKDIENENEKDIKKDNENEKDIKNDENIENIEWKFIFESLNKIFLFQKI